MLVELGRRENKMLCILSGCGCSGVWGCGLGLRPSWRIDVGGLE